MFNSGLNSKRRGFTVAEVLIAVLIIAVLCGIAAPNVVRYKKSLDNMDLENTAKMIGYSIQNKLTGIKTEGRLSPDNLGGPLSASGETYSFSSSNYEGPLTDVSLSTVEGSYTASFNIKTGDMQKVAYTRGGKTAEWTFDGSSIASDFGNDELTMDPVVSVDNGDDIVVITRIDDIEKGGEHLSSYFTSCGSFDYSITLSGPGEDGSEKKITIHETGDSSDNRGSYVESRISIDDDVLDGFDRNGFITVQVESSYAVPFGRVIKTDASASRNTSGFHGLFGNGTIGNIIDISCQRHLTNLTGFDTERTSVAVIQSKDIVLDSEYVPVFNDYLFGNASTPGIAEYKGNGKTVYSLNINSNELSNAGVFAYTNCCISGLNISSPSIAVSGAACSAGALCGTVYGGEISECTVTSPYFTVTGDGSAAGALCGTVFGGEINNCEVSGEGMIFSSMFSGGMLGRAGSADIFGCVSSADVQGDLFIGGLVGSCDGTHFTLCSASGDITCISPVEGAYSGGFAGVMGAGYTPADRLCEIAQCTSSGNVSSNDFAGGFVGWSGGIIEQCISFGRVTDDTGDDEAEFLAGFCPIWLDPDTRFPMCYFTECYYKCAPGWNDKFSNNPEGVLPQTS